MPLPGLADVSGANGEVCPGGAPEGVGAVCMVWSVDVHEVHYSVGIVQGSGVGVMVQEGLDGHRR